MAGERRVGRGIAVLALALPVAFVGCTTSISIGPPTTTTTTIPEFPLIHSFAVSSPAAAPALVSYTWNVTDPEFDTLTCRLDTDGDSVVDLTLVGCEGIGGRNVEFESPTSGLAVLEVSDGTHTTFASAPMEVTADTSETYDIVVRSAVPLDPDVQAAFDAAEAKWESVLVRGVPDRTLNLPANKCDGTAPLESSDDVVIDAVIEPIDGDGGVLGQAGPCATWSGDDLTRLGLMAFDSDDVADMITAGTLDDVVLHEMGHVLGIGTLWDDHRSLLTGAGTPNPRYVGGHAIAEWDVLGGSGNVPVEGGGGPGTADSHWRESIFDDEVMTGYVDTGGNVLSRLSIASLADLGYQVDIDAADPYALPPGGFFRIQPAPAAPHGVMLRPTPVSV